MTTRAFVRLFTQFTLQKQKRRRCRPWCFHRFHPCTLHNTAALKASQRLWILMFRALSSHKALEQWIYFAKLYLFWEPRGCSILAAGLHPARNPPYVPKIVHGIYSLRRTSRAKFHYLSMSREGNGNLHFKVWSDGIQIAICWCPRNWHKRDRTTNCNVITWH